MEDAASLTPKGQSQLSTSTKGLDSDMSTAREMRRRQKIYLIVLHMGNHADLSKLAERNSEMWKPNFECQDDMSGLEARKKALLQALDQGNDATSDNFSPKDNGHLLAHMFSLHPLKPYRRHDTDTWIAAMEASVLFPGTINKDVVMEWQLEVKPFLDTYLVRLISWSRLSVILIRL